MFWTVLLFPQYCIKGKKYISLYCTVYVGFCDFNLENFIYCRDHIMSLIHKIWTFIEFFLLTFAVSVIIKVVKETHSIRRESFVSSVYSINLFPNFFWLIVSEAYRKKVILNAGVYISCRSYLQQKLRSFLLLHTFNERSEIELVWHAFSFCEVNTTPFLT